MRCMRCNEVHEVRDGQTKPFRENFGFGPFKPTELVLQNLAKN